MKKVNLLGSEDKRLLFFIMSMLAMVVLPGFIYVMTNGKTLFSPGSLFLYVLFIVEFLFYFNLIDNRCKPGHILMVINLSILFLFIRFVAVFVSFLLISNGIGSGDLIILYKMWYAQPLIPILQIIIFYFIMTDILIVLVPHLLKEEYLIVKTPLELTEEELVKVDKKEVVKEEEGDVFSQILSFNALPLSLKKFVDLEGALIINNEGLVIWKDIPSYINAEDVAGRFLQVMRESLKIDEKLHSAGITSIVFETSQNSVLIFPTIKEFCVVFIFSKKIELKEIESRLKNFSIVLKEFLERRYREMRG